MPQRTWVHWLLEALAAAAVLTVIALIGIHWGSLPERIPTHFNAAGEPNGWGPRNMLLILGGVAVGLYIVLSVAARAQRFVNVPFQLRRDDPHVQAEMLSMVIMVKTVTLVQLAWTIWRNIQTAQGHAEGLGPWFLPIYLTCLFLPLAYHLARLWRYRID